MNIISLRTQPEYKEQAIKYLQKSWPEVDPVIYENCIHHSIDAQQDLPQWYLLVTAGKIIGCAGLITNDFISRMDLYPWLCALFIDEQYRGNNYAALLIERAKKETKASGFKHLNLCTDFTGYYEKYGFSYIGQGYHPWEAQSRIYQVEV